jgi:hypothetical protein
MYLEVSVIVYWTLSQSPAYEGILGPGGCTEMNPYAPFLAVVNPQTEGPVVGSYAGQPIAASVVDCFGRRYFYAGAAPRDCNGQYDFDALAPGEWIVEPGLVYTLGNSTRDGSTPAHHHGHGSATLRRLREVLSGWLH